MPTLPFKLNRDCRRHIPKQKHKLMNWRAYDASLRQRGSLTVWFTDEAIEAWRSAPRTTPGGQPRPPSEPPCRTDRQADQGNRTSRRRVAESGHSARDFAHFAARAWGYTSTLFHKKEITVMRSFIIS